MGVRNCKDIGDNLQKIISRLMANRDLIKLLYYNDKDPLSHDFSEIIGEGKTYSTYDSFIKNEIFEKLIKIVPRVGPKETSNSIIAIKIDSGMNNSENNQFKNVSIGIEVFTPLTNWIIKSDNLRPFYILGEIQNSLNGITINGLGKLIGGSFELNFLTEEISCYSTNYYLQSYD